MKDYLAFAEGQESLKFSIERPSDNKPTNHKEALATSTVLLLYRLWVTCALLLMMNHFTSVVLSSSLGHRMPSPKSA